MSALEWIGMDHRRPSGISRTTHLKAKAVLLEDRENVGSYGLAGEKYREDGGPSALAVIAPVGGRDRTSWELRDGARLREAARQRVWLSRRTADHRAKPVAQRKADVDRFHEAEETGK